MKNNLYGNAFWYSFMMRLLKEINHNEYVKFMKLSNNSMYYFKLHKNSFTFYNFYLRFLDMLSYFTKKEMINKLNKIKRFKTFISNAKKYNDILNKTFNNYSIKVETKKEYDIIKKHLYNIGINVNNEFIKSERYFFISVNNNLSLQAERSMLFSDENYKIKSVTFSTFYNKYNKLMEKYYVSTLTIKDKMQYYCNKIKKLTDLL